MFINNLSYAEALALPDPKHIWMAGDKVYVDTNPHIEIPESISNYQARIAFLKMGILPSIENTIAVVGGELKIRWDFAAIINRNHPDIAKVQALLGWTDKQCDEFFIEAAKH